MGIFSKEAGVERVSGSLRGEVALAIYRTRNFAPGTRPDAGLGHLLIGAETGSRRFPAARPNSRDGDVVVDIRIVLDHRAAVVALRSRSLLRPATRACLGFSE